ncbi:acyl-CoA dehydrogenase family protein [Mycolicibacterium holsaticum]|uniref:Acyl-[acyl-carrier-protein] dehydrogenase MbtN n=1 Tax=Mycolicibacterium holsaticum TaxID=152142 RepID=A0A1E3S2N6_9MYCO|nr:acyl-CoA dehydrogenase family protein [Mycolicibacterium holsaticum]ODQ96378.1 acyl-CoA dehydrogenase [Mycolicibacterium holsaticum]
MSQTRPSWATDEIADLYDMAWDFFSSEIEQQSEEWSRNKCVDREFWLRAGKLGLLCASVPEEYGGGGGGFLHHAAIASAYARTGDKSWGNAIHSGVVADYLVAYGTEEQKQHWLPRMATGEVVAALGMSEPEAGSDLKNIRTTAIRHGDHYLINGAKTFITNGSTADMIVVAAKTDPSAGGRGISLLIVDTKLPGFSVGRVLDKIGQHGSDTAELSFDNVHVPADQLLGVEGRGFPQMMVQLPQERLIIGINAVGATELAVDLTVRYAKERHVFGAPLMDMQNTRFELAECATLARIAREFLDNCIVGHSVNGVDTATAAMCKWWLTHVQCEVIDRCLQLFGGYGYMREYPIARLYCDARAQKIYGGANEIQKELIARSL